MPERIDMTIYWSNENDSMSFYTIMNYYFDQALLFTFVDPQIIYEWIWDVFAREPKEIIIDTIKY